MNLKLKQILRKHSKHLNYNDMTNTLRTLIIYKHLCQKQEEYQKTHPTDEYKNQFYINNLGYCLENEERFDNLTKDDATPHNLVNAVNKLKTSPNKTIQTIFETVNIDLDNTTEQEYILDIINLLSENKNNKELFQEVKYLNLNPQLLVGEQSNEHLCKLIASILKEVKTDSIEVYDPNCNMADTFIEINNKNLNVDKYYGLEDNYEFYKIALMQMLLYDVDDYDIKYQNAITDDGFNDKKFNTLISVSYDTARINKETTPQLILNKKFERLQENNLRTVDYLYILEMLYHLDDNGIIIFASPSNMLFRGFNQKEIREILINENYLDCVIQLPISHIEKYPRYMGILIFKKSRIDNEDVLFINASNSYEKIKNANVITTEYQDMIAKTYANRQEIKHFSKKVSIDEIKSNRFNINVPLYVDAYENKSRNVKDILVENQEIDKEIEILNNEIDLSLKRIIK